MIKKNFLQYNWSFKRGSIVSVGRAARASSIGANTVNVPSPFEVSVSL